VFNRISTSFKQNQSPQATWQHQNRLINDVKNKMRPGQVSRLPSNRMAYRKFIVTHCFHAVECPWDMLLQPSDYIPQAQSMVNVKIIDLFHDAGGELLILAEPGLGKTSVLLSLAHSLAVLAEQNLANTTTIASIPVVFNLSSWNKKRKSLADWLVGQLNAEYQIPKNIGRMWIKNQQLLLLLDGLEDVEPKLRPGCVKALNDFHQKYSLVKMAIGCRTIEYASLPFRLKLQDAIVLHHPDHKLLTLLY
jgi:hypothetical protein